MGLGRLTVDVSRVHVVKHIYTYTHTHTHTHRLTHSHTHTHTHTQTNTMKDSPESVISCLYLIYLRDYVKRVKNSYHCLIHIWILNNVVNGFTLHGVQLHCKLSSPRSVTLRLVVLCRKIVIPRCTVCICREDTSEIRSKIPGNF
jgi:hypothetical protein